LIVFIQWILAQKLKLVEIAFGNGFQVIAGPSASRQAKQCSLVIGWILKLKASPFARKWTCVRYGRIERSEKKAHPI